MADARRKRQRADGSNSARSAKSGDCRLLCWNFLSSWVRIVLLMSFLNLSIHLLGNTLYKYPKGQ
jgi:hypothetical protein